MTKLISNYTRERINGGEFWSDDSVRLLSCIENGERIIEEIESNLGNASAELARVTAERDELRAIVDGRRVTPTLAEIAKHGGEWLCDGETVALYFSDNNDTKLRVRAASMTASIGDTVARVWLSTKNAQGALWIALDDGRPCAWPKVTP